MSRSRDLTPVHSAAPVSSLEENAAIDRLPANSGQQLTALLVQLRGLDTKDAKTTQLHEKIQAAAIKYKQHDFKASRYVFRTKMFAEDIILGFEGVREGTYTLKEVLDDLNEQINGQNLLTPLEEVAQGLGSVAREIGECIGQSGPVASAYRQAGHGFELMRNVTVEIANRRADASALGTMAGLSSNTVNVLTLVCSVLSQTASAWATAEQQRLQENQRLLEDLRMELGQVSRIVENQGKLVGNICELLRRHRKQRGNWQVATPLVSWKTPSSEMPSNSRICARVSVQGLHITDTTIFSAANCIEFHSGYINILLLNLRHSASNKCIDDVDKFAQGAELLWSVCLS